MNRAVFVSAALAATAGATITAILLATRAVTSGPSPLMFVLADHHTANPVDYQTWCGDCNYPDDYTAGYYVLNPHDNWPYSYPTTGKEPGCMWDSDDFYSWRGANFTGASLAPGASALFQECRYYGNGSPNGGGEVPLLTDVKLAASARGLSITTTWAWDQNGTPASITATVPAAAKVGNNWAYFDCVNSPPAALNGEPAYVTIPNSHGGVSTPQSITVTVTNPTSKTISKIVGHIDAGGRLPHDAGCSTFRDP